MRRILAHTFILFMSVLIAAFVINHVEGRTTGKRHALRLQRVQKKSVVQRTRFSTKDGVQIVGDYYAVTKPKGTVLFLHMMPATRGSWKALAEGLQKKSIASLAIDFRGHGESTNGGKLDYKNFSDEEQQKKRFDVEAAMNWLASKGAKEQKIILVGASIGANLAVDYAASRASIPAVALLSPGLDYRGVLTEPAAKALSSSQKLFLAASAPDDQYSFDTIRALAIATKAQVVRKELTGLGHGTTMTDRDARLSSSLIQWITSIIGR